jgi:hypothetical protein
MKQLIFSIFMLCATNYAFAQTKLTTYTNTTHAFSVQYPAHYSVSPASTSDDGRSFTAPNGKAVIYATSGYEAQVEPNSIETVYAYYKRQYKGKTTYKVLKNNGFVITGKSDADNIFYLRCYYNAAIGEYRKLLFEYNVSESDDFDVLIPKIVGAFRD